MRHSASPSHGQASVGPSAAASSRDGQQRNAVVCLRCRSKKIKCDQVTPRCLPCQRASEACLHTDPVTGRDLPRSYLGDLEERIRELEAQLSSRSRMPSSVFARSTSRTGRERIAAQGIASLRSTSSTRCSTADLSEDDASIRAAEVAEAHVRSRGHPKSLHAIFADGESTEEDSLTQADRPSFDAFGIVNAIESTDYASRQSGSSSKLELPPHPMSDPLQRASDVLFDEYFIWVNTQVPVLDRKRFRERINHLRSRDAATSSSASISKTQDFILMHLILALGWTRRRSEETSDRRAQWHFYTARTLQRRHALSGQHNMFGAHVAHGVEARLKSIQITLLSVLFSLMRPVSTGTWHLAGEAMRQCTALELHTCSPHWLKDIDRGSEQRKILHSEAQRIFWASYCLDRYLSVNMRMPLSIADSAITMPVPWTTARRGEFSQPMSAEDIHSYYASLVQGASKDIEEDATRWISVFYIELRRIQSEIFRRLSEEGELYRAFDTEAQWQSNIELRLAIWRDFAPLYSRELSQLGCSFDTDLTELNFHQAQLLLYGLQCRHTELRGLDKLETTASNIIRLVSKLEESGSIHFTWITLHNLCVAATLYLFCTWQKCTTGTDADPHAPRSVFRKSDEVSLTGRRVQECFDSIGERSRSGQGSREVIQQMFRVTRELVMRYEEGRGRGEEAAIEADPLRPWLKSRKRSREDIREEEGASRDAATKTEADMSKSSRRLTNISQSSGAQHRQYSSTIPHAFHAPIGPDWMTALQNSLAAHPPDHSLQDFQSPFLAIEDPSAFFSDIVPDLWETGNGNDAAHSFP